MSRSASWSRCISHWRCPAARSSIPTLYSLQVFTNVLGGGMSSRLFQEARERRGLCYSIYSFHIPYSDIGMFGLYAGTDAADTSELMRLIVDEIASTAETISEPEVARAKAQMKAGLLMALESSGARIEQLARQMITRGRPIPLDELVAKVDAVTVESARAAGRDAAFGWQACDRRCSVSVPDLKVRRRLPKLSRAGLHDEVFLSTPMAFFRTINFSEPLPSLEGEGVVLRMPQITDFEEWAALREN